ncbi:MULTISPECIES: DUF4350 domain-containing protein [unclassified Mycolicibacterium]|uniref:DUF4350 domain-containing protein n=1 Tax=unclassified Mycolicibacterium TaxID=2636767 RepID=UPI0012DCC2DD|nr:MULTISPECIES: DUF4350 domain-containing protein [unclassified Mycolicibacterium]MUL84204.1 DUF4350 domain-containing protein [Mycolicibacterium sp. CBMA 329]MUL89730.1 DUF4350 domain-containing protein [Mycolicibacterium sp. CBMA 331]MUL99905.1 DUF4350 domain-containing protein [Mycolicibacterium sp. CBMA 334]MUM39245.1 DUF4350 domain-containing protein [Mycolicibacterium sp. CBMA 247]MUM46331.1 DUF4350 domain-containing protein [Mycolicibacterium sp. CBMA 294]
MKDRWRTARWVLLAFVVIVAMAVVTVHLTAPRPGGAMDPESTSPDGTHALISLLRDHGVDVITAANADEVARAARPGTLLVVAQTMFLSSDKTVAKLAEIPGDLLLVAPAALTREKLLAPQVRLGKPTEFRGGEPECELPEANRAGTTQLGTTDTYTATGSTPVTLCYGGALARYQDAHRSVTVVGSGDFMTNSRLLKEGNAALAMNLAGAAPRVIWYAPQHFEGSSAGGGKLSDLIPPQVRWIVLQLCLVVALLAVAQARRLGPLVAESLPVVVRASETVEGRGRLYRSRRARDRAAGALRTAALGRLLPRLGLSAGAAPQAVAAAVAARCGTAANSAGHVLFGPPPATDAELVHLAHQLDDIERQVAQS